MGSRRHIASSCLVAFAFAQACSRGGALQPTGAGWDAGAFANDASAPGIRDADDDSSDAGSATDAADGEGALEDASAGDADLAGRDAGPRCDGGLPCDFSGLGCGIEELCGDGRDDDCNGEPDDGCYCVPGAVQTCFAGPPGLRGRGACRDGMQRCIGPGEFGRWGRCEGGFVPTDETCNALDDDCDGRTDEGIDCTPHLRCPAPGDERVPDTTPFAPYVLDGGRFFPETEAVSWLWIVRGGPCDRLLPRPTFTMRGSHERVATFVPTLSGDYEVTLTVSDHDGVERACTFVVHVGGPGLRVQLCTDASTTVDEALYVHDPRNTDPWFDREGNSWFATNASTCGWHDCEALVRVGHVPRASWGYAPSPLARCEHGPHGADWVALGYCPNPRLDIDNFAEDSGLPENISIDTPHDGDRFRVMVQNWSGPLAHPLVSIYCGGRLQATFGAAPDLVRGFVGRSALESVGAMWRVADVTVHVDEHGETTGCDVAPIHPPGESGGTYVTYGDPSY